MFSPGGGLKKAHARDRKKAHARDRSLLIELFPSHVACAACRTAASNGGRYIKLGVGERDEVELAHPEHPVTGTLVGQRGWFHTYDSSHIVHAVGAGDGMEVERRRRLGITHDKRL